MELGANAARTARCGVRRQGDGMEAKHWLAVLSLVTGVPVAAYGLSRGALLVVLAGLALVLAAVALVGQWIAGRNKPQQPIKPAANAAWRLKDEPPPGAPRK
jgi:hypothetical protein